jgi:uncharacterized membrane protein
MAAIHHSPAAPLPRRGHAEADVPALPIRPSGLLEAGLLLAILLAAGYTALFAAVSILRYLNFHYSGDTADYAQILWNTVHGRLLQKTDIYGVGTGLRGGHAEPLLLLLAIPYAIFPDPRTILLLQTLALASGGPLVYAMARVHGHGQRVALGLAAFYLVFPLVHYANLWDFHPDPFAVPALLGALLAFDLRRWRLLALCLAVILLTKEQMPLFVLGLGVYWWRWRGERRAGMLAVGAALLYGLLVLLPWYLLTSSQFGHDYNNYFSDALQAIQNSRGLAGHLQALATVLGQEFRLQNLVLALLPSGLLFLLDGSAIVTVLPLAGLYVSNRFTNDFWFHHYVTCVPIILYGTSRVLLRPAMRGRAGMIAVLLCCWAGMLGYLYAASSLNMMHWIYQPSIFLTADDHVRAQNAIIRVVPAGAPLDSDSSLAAHLANRTYLYQIQVPSQPRLVPYTLLDLHQDMQNPPSWLVLNNRNTYSYIQHTSGYRLARADRRHGLYLFANCARFPAAMGCRR